MVRAGAARAVVGERIGISIGQLVRKAAEKSRFVRTQSGGGGDPSHAQSRRRARGRSTGCGRAGGPTRGCGRARGSGPIPREIQSRGRARTRGPANRRGHRGPRRRRARSCRRHARRRRQRRRGPTRRVGGRGRREDGRGRGTDPAGGGHCNSCADETRQLPAAASRHAFG